MLAGDLTELQSKFEVLLSTNEANDAQIKLLEAKCQEEAEQHQATRVLERKWELHANKVESELSDAVDELSQLRVTNGELTCRLSLAQQAINVRDCDSASTNSVEFAQLKKDEQNAQKSLLQLQEDNAQLHARLVQLDKELKATGQLRQELNSKSKRLSPR